MEMDLIISLGQSQQFNESSYCSMLINHFGCMSPYATLLTVWQGKLKYLVLKCTSIIY